MAKKYKFNKTDNTLNRHDDTVYKAIDVDGSTRLIKYTDRGYVELNINDGSELRSIGKEEALRLMPRDQKGNPKPLTFEEKTAYIEKFDASDNTYLDPKQTTLEEVTTDTATDKWLDTATDRANKREYLEATQLRREGSQPDSPYSGTSISMEEFNTNARAKALEANRNARALANTSYSLASPESGASGISTSEYIDKGGLTGTVDPAEIPYLQVAMAPPELNTKGLDVGTGGPGLLQVDDAFYRDADGRLMKDSGWFGGEDTVATQADIDAGITEQNSSSPWGTTQGWQAAGSVMKGVGGLASAYTGIKNYQLARDAHNAQQNQWQANFDQRLTAYQENKDLMNEEIRRKNRTLKARGQAESYQLI